MNIWVKTIPVILSDLDRASILYVKINELGLYVDNLINNAGFGKFCEFAGQSFETYHKMSMLSIETLTELTHLCLPAMKDKNKRGIMFVASIVSFQPLPCQTALLNTILINL